MSEEIKESGGLKKKTKAPQSRSSRLYAHRYVSDYAELERLKILAIKIEDLQRILESY